MRREGELGGRGVGEGGHGQVGGGGGGGDRGPVARGADAAGGEGLQEGEKDGLVKRRSRTSGIWSAGVRYLAERRKAKLSVDALLAIDVDGDQVLTEGATARGVNYGYRVLSPGEERANTHF